ncbi:anaphase-promoting complex, cyclosome, subunit 4-domain-containing protein [Scheffersomyces xylosifermentans]|uniref:anaphase-promoting complex, cyclosome, subunit 4-domain-containing protein n=1 Tax=Scheffersomyces xylosifermentans TaxID=1304137 RepID=UPI00315CB27C
MTTQSTLSIVSANKFMGFADGNIIRWCPTLNLLAVSMNKMSIWVYRLNGERIYSVNNKSPITSISFIKNGSCFCLSGVDGLIKIYDSNNGKLLKIIERTFNNIALINWNNHEIRYDGKFDNLFKVDILRNMPKLDSADEAVASEIEEINSNDLNYLVIVDSNSISVNFNNLLTVNDIPLPHQDAKFSKHLDNNDLFNQFFIIEIDQELQLVALKNKVGGSPALKKSFVDIIIKFCKLTSILNYIKTQISVLQTEIKPFFQLFDRYLANLSDSLTDSNDIMSLENYFLDLLLTNLIPVESKDFWLNQFGERGFKRLSKLGNTTYDTMKEIIFSHLVASIERLIIILNDLNGQSQWFSDSDSKFQFGLKVADIQELLEKSKQMLKVSYKFIWDINEEKNLFNNFINWIKVELIEKLSKEDDFQSFLNQQQPCSFKESDIIKYLNNSLFESKTWKFINPDLSANDFLKSSTASDVDIPTIFEELNSFFIESLLASFTDFFKSSFFFNESGTSLNISSQDSNSTLTSLSKDYGLITSLDSENSQLKLTRFLYENPSELVTSTIDMNNYVKLINFDFRSSQELVLLIKKNDEYGVVVASIEDLVQNGQSSLNFDQIKIVDTLHHSDLNLLNPKVLALNKEASVSYACILDANRQNYVVLNLGSQAT